MRIRQFRLIVKPAALAILLAFPAQQALAAACTWNPASGDWSTAGLWSCGAIPGAADSASIAAAKTVTITLGNSILTLSNAGQINIDAFGLNLAGGGATTNSGVINVGGASTANLGISAGHNINNAGGTMNVGAGSVINQFGSTITGGTINTIGTGALVAFSNANNVLSGVTLNGVLDVATNANARERIANGMTLNGNVNIANGGIVSLDSTLGAANSIGGTGTFNLNDGNARLALEGTGTTTLGANIVVRGQGNIGQPAIAGGNNTLVNNGRISADVNGFSLTIVPGAGSGTVTNNNILDARGGGALFLSANVNNSAGQINAQNGSVVVHNGVTITGGTLGTSGSGEIRAVSSAASFLDGVTLGGTLDLTHYANSRERIINGATINGAVNIANGGILSLDSSLTSGGNQTLGGTATINLNDAGARLAIDGTGATTLGSNVVVRGQGNIGTAINVAGNNLLTNNGLISADVSGGTLNITAPASGGGSSFINNGTLRAINGASLLLLTNITSNTGSQIVAGAGSSVVQNGVTLNGVINASGTGVFTAVSSASNVLNGVNFTGTLDLTSISNSRERIANGATINGAVNIANGGILSLDSSLTSGGNQTLGGTATINLNDAGARLAIDGTGATTLGSNVVVRGQGNIGTAINVAGNNLLTNNGLISADVSGGTLNITAPASGGGSSFINNGTLRAINGASLLLSTNITSNTGSQIVAGAGSSVVQNGVTLNGVINASGTGVFTAVSSASNVLNGVNFTGTLDLTSISNSRERIANGATINGAVNIANGGILSLDSSLTSGGNQTLGGTATINLNDAGARLAIDGTGATTLGSNVVVRGQGNIGTAINVAGNNLLTNNGLISADVSGGTLNITAPASGGGSSIVNNNILEARNGGTLVISTNVNNAAGQINAQNGSQVLQNSVTITHGTLGSNGTGVIAASSSASNFLDGVTLSGVLNMTNIANSRDRLINANTVNGQINIANGGIVSLDSGNSVGGSAVVNGTGVINLNDATARLAIDGSGTTTLGAALTVRGQGNIGQAINAAGNNVLTNNGLILADGGTLTISAPASGSSLLAGTGTLQVNGGTLNVSTGNASTQGKLIIGATGSLGLGTQNLTITNDYTNVQAGSGNSFNRRAGVTGTGQILAGGNAAQAITGTGVTGGNTTNATLTIGNMRVGANTFNYQLANTGTTGPTLRGAIQTNVNGGNITDARLSGTGVTASNYNAGGPNGNSGNLGVTFTAASAGAQAALSGQAINLRSNFDNIADQKLNIVLAGGAAAYNAAAGSAAPSPVVVANQRVGGSNSQVLTVSNTAAAGAFSEDLRATFGSNGGAALNNGGSVVSLIAGGNNASAMTARVDTSTAGAKTGSVTLNYETLGTVNGVSNGLGTASAGSQTINVSGNVYRLAQGDTTPLAANFGNRHVGDSVSQTLTIKNLSVNDGFSEKLNASFGTNSGNATNNGVSVSLLAAGGSNAASMSVGMDTSSVGNKSGSVAVNYQSDGAGTSGLSSISAGSQTVNVSGSVYRLAQANTLGAVSFGNVHLGDSVQQALSISNTAANDGFSEKLNASFGNATDARITNNGGSISELAASATNSSMVVGLNTAAAGTVNGSIAVNFASDGAGTSGLGISALATQNVGVSGSITTQGNVYRLASASPATPNPVNFGNVRINTATDQALTIGNTAANDGFSEKLNASISSNGAPVTASGSFNLLGPQASDNSSLHVGIDTSSAGAKSGSATIALVSDGTGTSGLGQTSLASQTVNVNGAVYRLANPQSVTSSLTLAARVGGSASGNVSITNQSPDIYTEALKVVAGAAPSSLFNIGNNPANIAAQGTGALQVSLNTGTAGSSTGTLTLNNTSTGAGTTNAADVSVGTSNVTLTGKVYTAAQATVQPAVNFGIVHVNEVVAVRGVSVQNSAPVTALNDTLAASIGGATGSFSSNNGSVAGLAAGGPANTTALTVGVNTATAGIFNGTANLALASQNPDMADLGLGSQSVALSAQVNKYANAEFGKVNGAGSLTRNGSAFTLNFGTWVQGSGLKSAILDVDNLVNGGPADDLNGSLNIVDGNDFFASLLLASFSNVGADASSGDALSFLFDTNALALGSYQDSVALTWFGTNGSGYRDANDHFYTLQVIGTIVQQGANVPEPNSLLLLTVALLAGLGVSRRRHSV